MKVRDMGKGMFMFHCYGCGHAHVYYTKKETKMPLWKFNGDLDYPTFTPSLVAKWTEGDEQMVCHFFVTDGKIRYLNDCTHDLAGQTVELEEIDE